MIIIVPKAKISSSQLRYFKALGNTFSVPKTPEASLPANVLLSFIISARTMLSPSAAAFL